MAAKSSGRMLHLNNTEKHAMEKWLKIGDKYQFFFVTSGFEDAKWIEAEVLDISGAWLKVRLVETGNVLLFNTAHCSAVDGSFPEEK